MTNLFFLFQLKQMTKSKSLESQVFYILSKPYDIRKNELLNFSHSSELYFPAYDMNQHLVGFYTEQKDSRNSTIVAFIPIDSQLIASFSLDFSYAKAVLAERIECNSLDVHVINSKMNNSDLESLKHNAIVHYWLSEVGLDDF